MSDTLIVYDYITQKLQIKSENLFVFGRSIGSGPATYLAARKKIAGLILMSAYTSIKDVSKTFMKGIFSFLVTDFFKNKEEIKEVENPIFLIHGKGDKLINYSHSQELIKAVKKTSIDFWFPLKMTHNNFHFWVDLIIPIDNFLSKIKYVVKIDADCLEIPAELIKNKITSPIINDKIPEKKAKIVKKPENIPENK